eukprot:GHVH01017429.1.p1 GENE.GHVH01017429.1~~GHVH01017429.1.p1  ORF type:complete len:255 (-),score=18.62 GHVH01017429.1:112-876(-)
MPLLYWFALSLAAVGTQCSDFCGDSTNETCVILVGDPEDTTSDYAYYSVHDSTDDGRIPVENATCVDLSSPAVDNTGACSDSVYCKYSVQFCPRGGSGLCTALPNAGQLCGDLGICATNLSCAIIDSSDGRTIQKADDSGYCSHTVVPGNSCSAAGPVCFQASNLCLDPITMTYSEESSICLDIKDDEQSCDEVKTFCKLGSFCLDNLCVNGDNTTTSSSTKSSSTATHNEIPSGAAVDYAVPSLLIAVSSLLL